MIPSLIVMLFINPSRNLPFLSIFQIFNKIIILTLVLQIISTEITPLSSTVAGSESDNYYSDEVYYQLAAEYEDNLRTSLAVKEDYETVDQLEKDRKTAEQRENYVSGDDKANQPQQKNKTEESYAEMASRLKCDNPWFWNAPKCTWIDVKAKHVISRTKRNAETSAWFLGSITGFVVVWLCGFYCCYQLKLRNRRKLLKLREKYTPGRIELPDGKIAQYQPTEEENKAYEELVKAIIIQEMSLMV